MQRRGRDPMTAKIARERAQIMARKIRAATDELLKLRSYALKDLPIWDERHSQPFKLTAAHIPFVDILYFAIRKAPNFAHNQRKHLDAYPDDVEDLRQAGLYALQALHVMGVDIPRDKPTRDLLPWYCDVDEEGKERRFLGNPTAYYIESYVASRDTRTAHAILKSAKRGVLKRAHELRGVQDIIDDTRAQFDKRPEFRPHKPPMKAPANASAP